MAIKDWPGGTITDIPVEPSGNYEDSAASGVWTVDQVSNYVKQNLWPTPGNIDPSKYVEGVFSTYLYTGNGTSQTITNGIDLAGEGGMVWTKDRTGTFNHSVRDSVRGGQYRLITNLTNSQADDTTTGITSFNSDGYTHGSQVSGNKLGDDYASWTFRKKAKFFDVVTYTGDGTSSRTIAHNLNGEVGSLILKRTDDSSSWSVYHKSLGVSQTLLLESTTGSFGASGRFGSSAPTTNTFDINDIYNVSGATYVAYLFASDAGGFGDDGSENIIKCGSAAATGLTTVDCGFEPQWVLIKSATVSNSWYIFDSMRGLHATGVGPQTLNPNLSSAEYTESADTCNLTSTGFTFNSARFNGNATYIYIAIRRPMKTPESGTEVFAASSQTIATGSFVNTGFVTDLGISRPLSSSTGGIVESRLTAKYMQSSSTGAESAGSSTWDYMNGYGPTPWTGSGLSSIAWAFKRATGFFDVVAYTSIVSDPTTMTVNHNLGVIPEIMIKKARQTNGVSNSWRVYHKDLNNGVNPEDYVIRLDSAGAASNSLPDWGSTAPTSTEFTAGYVESGTSYVTYLFASVAGVSKVGSYTGTGADLNVDCGFSAGARFILIKRTDSTGDWYVWDSVRGIVAGNDPYLLLNSTAAEVTSTDYIDPLASGFTVTSTAPAALNASGGTYIFLAIA